MSSTYEVGELVDISIRGARIESMNDVGIAVCSLPAHNWRPTINLRAAGVSVTRVAPPEWPPQPGDAWINPQGLVVFAHESAIGDDVFLRDSHGNAWESSATALDHIGPLSLEYRPGWTKTPPAGRDSETSPEAPAIATTDQLGNERAEAVAGLRELVDFLDAHPDVPFDRYAPRIQVHVSNLPHMRGKDEPAMFAELTRIAGVLGADADLRNEPGAPHPRAARTFRGGARYEAIYVTEAYRRGYTPADTTAAGVTTDTAPADEAPIRGDASTAVPVLDGDEDGAAGPDEAQGGDTR